MSSQNEGGGQWIDRIKNKVKLGSDDLGCGCVVLLFSSIIIFILYLIIPPFLENWERPIRIGDLGRTLFSIVMLSALYLPVKLIFFESKDSFWVKVKEFVFYALWIVALIYVLECCLNTKGVSLSELFRDGSFRYLR
jgi:hypothetical protein